MADPKVRITDRQFVYTPAARTDVRATFRRHGWVGPEERRSNVAQPAPRSRKTVQREAQCQDSRTG